jgi:hypothetical protein
VSYVIGGDAYVWDEGVYMEMRASELRVEWSVEGYVEVKGE